MKLLSNREKLEYFLTHNAKIVIDITTSYELLEENFIDSQLSDNLFSYENAGLSKQRASSIHQDNAHNIDTYEHTITSMNEVKQDAPLEKNMDISKPPRKDNIKDNQIEDKDYRYLILNLAHYKLGMLFDKDKSILQNEDTSLKIRE